MNAKEEAFRLAKKHNGFVLKYMKYGKLVAYKVMFEDSHLTVIFKNRKGGEL